jgi:hypothetical protein
MLTRALRGSAIALVVLALVGVPALALRSDTQLSRPAVAGPSQAEDENDTAGMPDWVRERHCARIQHMYWVVQSGGGPGDSDEETGPTAAELVDRAEVFGCDLASGPPADWEAPEGPPYGWAWGKWMNPGRGQGNGQGNGNAGPPWASEGDGPPWGPPPWAGEDDGVEDADGEGAGRPPWASEGDGPPWGPPPWAGKGSDD